MSEFSYDERCEDLAEHFLAGSEKPATEENKKELAQAIQDAVENWFAGFEEEHIPY